MLRTAAASAGSLVSYNALIARSKAHWVWPDGHLEQALQLLRITPDYLARSNAFEVLLDGALVGFSEVTMERDYVILDHLWINPDHFGRGAGAFAVAQVVALTRGAGRSAIDVWPDPPAEPFYLKQGFEATQDRLSSRVPGGPAFRRFRLRVSHDLQPRLAA